MKKILVAVLFVFLQIQIWSQTDKPVLFLNTEMHTGKLNRVAVDKKATVFLTCANDKTARLWDISTGELIRTFRVPADPGDDGMLYACALSPDGSIAVVGGFTGPRGNKNVYVYDTRTGDMITYISGFHDVIFDIEYSPDGKWIACSSTENPAIYIIDAKKFTVVKKLDNAQERVNNICFDKRGQLASVCYDGYLRLYSKKFKLLREVKVTGGKYPYSLAVSPDGRKIALGFIDTNRVQVYDARKFELLYEPDISGIYDYKYTDIMAWSLDGEYLYSGGTMHTKKDGEWWRIVRVWDKQGKGGYKDITASYNTIMDMKVLPDDTLLVCGTQPDFIRTDRDGNVMFFREGPTFSFRNSHYQYLRVNPTGTVIGFEPDKEDPFTFDVMQRYLSDGQAPGKLARTEAPGLSVTDWEDTKDPKLNGKLLDFLRPFEQSRCVDISGSRKGILFGANWNLYYLDDNGEEIWQTSVQSTCWSVNIADNERVAVVTLSDGTIHWYRISDGQLLLSLYIHRETRKWIAWTPSGYYDCSPGGQNYIGWQVNSGYGNAPDFFSADRFADQYYRPDIIQLILSYFDEPSSIAEANRVKNIKSSQAIGTSFPPVVNILSPQNRFDSDKKTINIQARIKVLSEQDPATEVKVLLNGRPFDSARGLQIKARDGDVRNFSVDLSPGRNIISVMAKNKNGWSEAETGTISVIYSGSSGSDDFVIKPKLYVLAIGVSDYENDDYDLLYPDKDASDFSALMKQQKGKLYRDVEVRLLTNKKATKDDIYDGLDWIRKQTTSKDIAMIFLAGHGMNDSTGRLYYLSHEADLERLRRTTVDVAEIEYTIENISGKVLYFMDTCHSGNIKVEGQRGGISATDYTGIINELSRAEKGAVVFCSSSGNQYSLENRRWGNGAFTKALIEGMSGKADFRDSGRITINMLDLYISERVKELTDGRQTPVTAKPDTVRDYPIIVVE